MADAQQPDDLVEDLIAASRYGDLEDVQQLLGQGVDANGKDNLGRTAIFFAAANGHLEIANMLIDKEVVRPKDPTIGKRREEDVNIANEDGNTALHWACLNGHVEVVRRLLQSGASVSALNSSQRTPVDEAISRDFEAVLEVINEFVGTAEDGEVDDVEDAEDGGEDTQEVADVVQ
mmetsp:Transcript_36629/g.79797  ORF Transcript_36629/g.79797 Transcript_36629/m.79797 type:complete len:176 (-) Transcript_36629:536-1063(-)